MKFSTIQILIIFQVFLLSFQITSNLFLLKPTQDDIVQTDGQEQQEVDYQNYLKDMKKVVSDQDQNDKVNDDDQKQQKDQVKEEFRFQPSQDNDDEDDNEDDVNDSAEKSPETKQKNTQSTLRFSSHLKKKQTPTPSTKTVAPPQDPPKQQTEQVVQSKQKEYEDVVMVNRLSEYGHNDLKKNLDKSQQFLQKSKEIDKQFDDVPKIMDTVVQTGIAPASRAEKLSPDQYNLWKNFNPTHYSDVRYGSDPVVVEQTNQQSILTDLQRNIHLIPSNNLQMQTLQQTGDNLIDMQVQIPSNNYQSEVNVKTDQAKTK